MVKIRTLPALTRVVVLESQLTFFADVTPSIIRWSSGYIAAFDESESAYSRSLHHYLFLQVSSPTTMAEIRTPRTFDISDRTGRIRPGMITAPDTARNATFKPKTPFYPDLQTIKKWITNTANVSWATGRP
jgi:hypothetical protein